MSYSELMPHSVGLVNRDPAIITGFTVVWVPWVHGHLKKENIVCERPNFYQNLGTLDKKSVIFFVRFQYFYKKLA